jgi:hypothetical protein
MSSVIALQARVLVFTEWVRNGLQNVVVLDIDAKRAVRLEGYENFDPMAVSHDGERVALFRGKHWEGQNNEIAVVAWRTGKRLFSRNDKPYESALFDLTGQLLLVTIEKQKTTCFDVARGAVIAQTNGKHETLRAHHFDATRNIVWLPPTSPRTKKRVIFDFATRTEKPAPAVVDAVSPGGAMYRLDTHITRLDADFQQLWSFFASRPGMDFDLPTHPLFPGTEDAVVYDEPKPGATWGSWVSRNATTGKELARRPQASGESPDVAWPGRYLVQPDEQLLWSVDTLKTKSVDLMGGLGEPALDVAAPVAPKVVPVETAPSSLDLTTTDVTTAMIIAGRTIAIRLDASEVEAMCERIDELAERLDVPLVVALSGDFSGSADGDEELPCSGVVGLLCSVNDAYHDPKPVSAEAIHDTLARAARLPWKEIEASLPPLDEPLSPVTELVALATGPLAGFKLAFGVPITKAAAEGGEAAAQREPSLEYAAGRDMSQEPMTSGVWGMSLCAFGDWPMEAIDKHLGELEDLRALVGSLASESRYFILPSFD